MKQKIANKASLVGAGGGLVLFAIFGLLPGSFLGGVMGLNIAGAIFGNPLTSSILPRLVVAASMLVGVMVSATIFVVGAGTLGWLLGTALDAARAPKGSLAEEKEKI